jgi:3D (Asp-Asp-Asp) domain-containing protein
MRAVDESIRVVGSKMYVNFYRRATVTDRWTAITIDMAAA